MGACLTIVTCLQTCLTGFLLSDNLFDGDLTLGLTMSNSVIHLYVILMTYVPLDVPIMLDLALGWGDARAACVLIFSSVRNRRLIGDTSVFFVGGGGGIGRERIAASVVRGPGLYTKGSTVRFFAPGPLYVPYGPC